MGNSEVPIWQIFWNKQNADGPIVESKAAVLMRSCWAVVIESCSAIFRWKLRCWSANHAGRTAATNLRLTAIGMKLWN